MSALSRKMTFADFFAADGGFDPQGVEQDPVALRCALCEAHLIVSRLSGGDLDEVRRACLSVGAAAPTAPKYPRTIRNAGITFASQPPESVRL